MNTNEFEGPIYTAREISQMLRIPLSSLWSLTKKGAIRGVKVGKHWRYLAPDLEAFLAKAAPAGRRHKDEDCHRRKHPRINCEFPGWYALAWDGEPQTWQTCRIRNIGLEGLCLNAGMAQGDGIVGQGDPVWLTFRIGEIARDFRLRGRAVWTQGENLKRAGIKFRCMDEEDMRAIQYYVG